MLLCLFMKKKTASQWQDLAVFFPPSVSRHFPTFFDHVLQCIPSGVHCLMYHGRDTFDFSRGHVTKNQPMAVPV